MSCSSVLAPPSYQESVFESTTIRERDGAGEANDDEPPLTFKPRYLAYNKDEPTGDSKRPADGDDDADDGSSSSPL